MISDHGFRGRTRWSRVVLFIVLTFGLTWSFVFLGTGTGEPVASRPTGTIPVGMLFPAFSALLLRMFLLRDSQLHVAGARDRAYWIPATFLLMTVLQAAVAVAAFTGSLRSSHAGRTGNTLMILWTLLFIFVYKRIGEEPFRRLGLQLGNLDLGRWFVAAYVGFLLLQPGLNVLFGLASFQGDRETIQGVAVPTAVYPVALLAYLLLMIVGNPLGGMALFFGEEYGWRGFLQDELAPLGRRQAALIIGLIWGLWHIPILLSGIHTYPPTGLGFLLAGFFFVLWGIIQSYAVLKTGSIWIAAFLHGVVNGVYAFTLDYVARPQNKLFAFGLGVYGLALLGAVVLLVLRDPVWTRPAPVREAASMPARAESRHRSWTSSGFPPR